MKEEELTEPIIGAALEVHKHRGPGLYEEIYERSLYHELRLRKVASSRKRSFLCSTKESELAMICV